MKTLKNGDFDEEKKMFFSHYRKNGKEKWCTIKAWENKNNRIINSKINTNKFNAKFPLKALVNSLKSNAKARNLIFEIDHDFIEDLWVKQNGLCFYTKIPMKLNTIGGNNPYQVSINRVNNTIGYTKENTVLCCQSITYMKNHYNVNIFNDFMESLKQTL